MQMIKNGLLFSPPLLFPGYLFVVPVRNLFKSFFEYHRLCAPYFYFCTAKWTKIYRRFSGWNHYFQHKGLSVSSGHKVKAVLFFYTMVKTADFVLASVSEPILKFVTARFQFVEDVTIDVDGFLCTSAFVANNTLFSSHLWNFGN